MPLNEAIAAVIARPVDKHPERVFTFQGQPLTMVRRYPHVAAEHLSV